MVRAGYHDGDGHKAVARAILLGKRTMDWVLNIGSIRPFARGEGYREKVKDVLMRETNARVQAIDDIWMDDELTAAEEDNVLDEGELSGNDTEDDGSDEEYEFVRKGDADKASPDKIGSSAGEIVEGPRKGEASDVKKERELEVRLERALEQRRVIHSWLQACIRKPT